jgi:hypothetical protein
VPHRPDFDSIIIKQLSSSFVGQVRGFRPWLTFNDLIRRTGINRKTLSRRLKRLKEHREIMKLSPSPNPPRRVHRGYRTFYRAYPETGIQLRSKGIQNLYWFLSCERVSHYLVETQHTKTSIRVQKSAIPHDSRTPSSVRESQFLAQLLFDSFAMSKV